MEPRVLKKVAAKGALRSIRVFRDRQTGEVRRVRILMDVPNSEGDPHPASNEFKFDFTVNANNIEIEQFAVVSNLQWNGNSLDSEDDED
jgi:hypothetical protein